MAKFELFVGLGRGFGGATSVGIHEFDSEKEAEELALQLAIEEYQTYEGRFGLLSYEDVRSECIEEVGGFFEDDVDFENAVNERYMEEMMTWILYYVYEIFDDEEEE